MKSRPIPELLFILLLFGVAWFPLKRLTDAGAAVSLSAPSLRPPDAPGDAGKSVPVFLRIKSAHAPERCAVSLPGGEPLWTWDNTAAVTSIDARIDLPIRPGAVLDLAVRATWSGGTPETALTLTLEPDGIEGESVTVWARGSFDDILTFFR